MIVDIIRSMGGVRGQIQINVFDMRVADTNPPFTIRRPTGVGRQNFPTFRTFRERSDRTVPRVDSEEYISEEYVPPMNRSQIAGLESTDEDEYKPSRVEC